MAPKEKTNGKSNKTLVSIAAIEAVLCRDLGSLCMDNEHDRAKMAWWIFETFCQGDYRENLHDMEVANSTKEMRTLNLGGGSGKDGNARGGSGGEGGK
jgi:hypothetical protein